MSDVISILSFSHMGNARDNHEDNFILKKRVVLNRVERMLLEKTKKGFFCAESIRDRKFLVAVSDGMGGHACGEVASLQTVQYLSSRWEELIEAVDDRTELGAIFADLNRSILEISQKNAGLKNMGATLCGVISNGKKLVGFNAGDSRLYRFDGREMQQLSSDHTEGQRMLKLKLLSEAEVARFPRRKHLYKYVGLNGELTMEFFEIASWNKGDVLMLCSDGLTDALSDAEIQAVLMQNDSITNRGFSLVNEAKKRKIGSGDNITVILICNGKEGEI